MNKILSIAAIVALATTLSFSQEGGIKFGIRAGFNLNDPIGDGSEEFDMGYGFGGGVAINIPIANILSFNPELSFYYKKLLSISESDEGMKMDANMNEFAISIPAMLQLTPVGGVPFYLAAGVQLDVPFSTEMYAEASYQGQKMSASEKVDDRAAIDFGVALGLGFNATSNFGIDLRCVIGLTSPGSDSGGDSSFNQYGIGLTYFF